MLSKLSAWRARRAARRAERDHQRGYAADYKRVAVAYTVEVIIIAVSLYGNWLLSQFYSHGDWMQLAMGMLAPVGYAAVEFCRVPMAIGIRTQPSLGVRIFCVIGIALAVLVTVKSLSQLGEMMFRPRLFDVVHAQEELHLAQATRDSLAGKIAAADTAVHNAAEALAAAQHTAQSINAQVAAIPKDACYPTAWTDRAGVEHRGTACKPNPTRAAVLDTMKGAAASVDKAKANYDTAEAARAALDIRALDQRVADASTVYREAVLHSQLHSFTAMVFGIAPGDVTDAQLHWFLRLFVFVPSFCAGIASTVIALTAIRRLPARTVALDPAGLGHLGAAIYAEAESNTMADLIRIVETAIQKRAAEHA